MKHLVISVFFLNLFLACIQRFQKTVPVSSKMLPQFIPEYWRRVPPPDGSLIAFPDGRLPEAHAVAWCEPGRPGAQYAHLYLGHGLKSHPVPATFVSGLC